MDKIYDVAIVGAGASGLFAAANLAKSDLSVLVLEKNDKPGEKLSITGGGRCNITNAEFDSKKFLENYGDAKKFLFSPFSKFSVKDTFDFFEKHGLPLVVEAKNRAFPETQKASDVTKLLYNLAKKGEVEFKFSTRLTDLQKLQKGEGEIFELRAKKQSFFARKVIFAVGGPSGKKLSKELPSAWRILQKLGHSVSSPSPNLVPLKTRARFVHHLAGLTMSFVALRFQVEGKTQFKKLGKVLFTHFGVSGPTVINSSKRALDILDRHKKLTLSIDFFPDTDFDKLDRRLIALIDKNKNKKFRNVLSELVPQELAKTIIFLVNKDLLEVKAHSVFKEERREIVRKLKDFHFNIVGAMDLDWAIVADGGVALEEVDFKTMQSRIIPGLYLMGDVLNINRPSGGYSLQLCWTTGFVASDSVITNCGF